MKKILFFAHLYWEIQWLHNVVKALDGEVWTDNEDVKNYCIYHEIKLAPNRENYQVLVLCVYHMGQNWDIINYSKNTGRQVVMLQHAWDAALHMIDQFWSHDTGKFDYFLVGCDQDYEWLSRKYGQNRVFNTGVPKLDDLYRVKKSKKSLKKIYEEIGHSSFLLANAPTDVICPQLYQYYTNDIFSDSPLPIVFKVHPGGKVKHIMDGLSPDKNKAQFQILEDEQLDRFRTYELIKASSGVVCNGSFMSIEASLMEKPVILYKDEVIPQDVYARVEYAQVNQNFRSPISISSPIYHPQYLEAQKQLANQYLLDGKNTDRVVNFLREHF